MVIEVCPSNMVIEVCPSISDLCFKFGPSFALAQLAWALWSFLSWPTCLPPVLARGSTINSSSQLQPHKSWWSPSPAWTPLARSVLQSTWAFKVHLLLSQHGHWFIQVYHALTRTSDVMARAGREPGALWDRHRTSNTSQKVRATPV
jgi:hypothetical protein